MSSLVTYEVTSEVTRISMDDGKVNALSPAMLEELTIALDRAAGEGGVTVLSGRPGVFCAGYDLKVMRDAPEVRGRLLEQGFAFALSLLEHPVPVVIECGGHAMAMGALLLLCADYRIGVEGAFKVTTNEVAIGMGMPWAGVEIARQRLTPTHFFRALALAEPYTPAESVDAGFLDEVVSAEDLRDAVQSKASQLATLSSEAHTAVKQRVRKQSLDAIRNGHQIDRESQGGGI
jgi:enoyl-CoA hydratase